MVIVETARRTAPSVSCRARRDASPLVVVPRD
jgi:hypothetical protein